MAATLAGINIFTVNDFRVHTRTGYGVDVWAKAGGNMAASNNTAARHNTVARIFGTLLSKRDVSSGFLAGRYG